MWYLKFLQNGINEFPWWIDATVVVLANLEFFESSNVVSW